MKIGNSYDAIFHEEIWQSSQDREGNEIKLMKKIR
jgi:hypothetical protein